MEMKGLGHLDWHRFTSTAGYIVERCQSLPDAIPMALRRDHLPRYIENIPDDPSFMRFKFVKPPEIMETTLPGNGE